jgi:hypothetical protein
MLSRPQGHSAAGRIMSMKNSNDKETRDMPVCSTVPQPTEPPPAPRYYVEHNLISLNL